MLRTAKYIVLGFFSTFSFEISSGLKHWLIYSSVLQKTDYICNIFMHVFNKIPVLVVLRLRENNHDITILQYIEPLTPLNTTHPTPHPAALVQVIYLLTLVLCQQKEEGKVQGQLNHTDSSQYIRDLKSQIAELKHEVRCASRACYSGAVLLPTDQDFLLFIFFFDLSLLA